jgi:hypothetical protein
LAPVTGAERLGELVRCDRSWWTRLPLPLFLMTNHYCEAVRQLDVVQADTTTIVDGLDTRLLDINRRGRPPHRQLRRGQSKRRADLAQIRENLHVRPRHTSLVIRHAVVFAVAANDVLCPRQVGSRHRRK